MKQYYVYILASKRNRTLYTGITSDLLKRVWEHKNKVVEGFTKEYDVNRLVYYECHDDAEGAILREKQIKKWKRQWKLELIEKDNSEWKDLYDDLVVIPGEDPGSLLSQGRQPGSLLFRRKAWRTSPSQ